MTHIMQLIMCLNHFKASGSYNGKRLVRTSIMPQNYIKKGEMANKRTRNCDEKGRVGDEKGEETLTERPTQVMEKQGNCYGKSAERLRQRVGLRLKRHEPAVADRTENGRIIL